MYGIAIAEKFEVAAWIPGSWRDEDIAGQRLSKLPT
jgi:hypothetical protein